MTKKEYKPGAKCRFYNHCIAYQTGILNEDAEKMLCGIGEHTKLSYIPRIHKTYSPTTKNLSSPIDGAVCPAFSEKIEQFFAGKSRELLEIIDFFWSGKASIEDIFKP